MQEPHSEGVAKRADIESCAGGDIAGEALTSGTGVRAVEPRSSIFGRRPRGLKGKALSFVVLSRAADEPGAVVGIQARQETLCTRTRRPRRRRPRRAGPWQKAQVEGSTRDLPILLRLTTRPRLAPRLDSPLTGFASPRGEKGRLTGGLNSVRLTVRGAAGRIRRTPSAPVAQLDRVPASGAGGRGFESRRARHFFPSLTGEISSVRLTLWPSRVTGVIAVL